MKILIVLDLSTILILLFETNKHVTTWNAYPKSTRYLSFYTDRGTLANTALRIQIPIIAVAFKLKEVL